jgi:hypothetical protein
MLRLSEVLTHLRVIFPLLPRRDRLWLKLLIYFIFLLDLLSTIFAIWWYVSTPHSCVKNSSLRLPHAHRMYYLFVDNWGKIDAFTKGDWRAFLSF